MNAEEVAAREAAMTQAKRFINTAQDYLVQAEMAALRSVETGAINTVFEIVGSAQHALDCAIKALGWQVVTGAEGIQVAYVFKP